MAKKDGSKNIACNDAIQTLCEVFKKLVEAGCLTEAQEISRVMWDILDSMGEYEED